MGTKTELSREEMQEHFAARVRAVYGMSVAEYLAARESGQLDQRPGSIELEVFSGEAAAPRRVQTKGPDIGRGPGSMAIVHSASRLVRQQRDGVGRAISAGLRKIGIALATK